MEYGIDKMTEFRVKEIPWIPNLLHTQKKDEERGKLAGYFIRTRLVWSMEQIPRTTKKGGFLLLFLFNAQTDWLT